MPLRSAVVALSAVLLLAGPAAAQGIGGEVVKDPYADVPPIRLNPPPDDRPRAEGGAAWDAWREGRPERGEPEGEIGKLSDELERELERIEQEYERELAHADREFDRELDEGKDQAEVVAKYRQRVRELERKFAEKFEKIDAAYFEKVWKRRQR